MVIMSLINIYLYHDTEYNVFMCGIIDSNILILNTYCTIKY